VRVICTYCKEAFEIDTQELKSMGVDVGKKGRITLHEGLGCVRCRNTGYRGRLGIYEVVPYTDSLKELTNANVDVAKIARKAQEEGMINLRENAVKKLLEGITTYQEVLRVTWEH
ncbi:type II/IV secretion system protein, partial [Thermodesulfobacteriota bacterium]